MRGWNRQMTEMKFQVVNNWICDMNGIPIKPFIPQLKFERTNDFAVIPTYASDGDSGMDVYATKTVILEPQEKRLFDLGLKVEIPRHPLHDFGYRWEVQFRPRSGISSKTPLIIPNSPGTIDNFYRDELKVILHNTAQKPHNRRVMVNYLINLKNERVDSRGYHFSFEMAGDPNYLENTYLIQRGDRIAQMVLSEVIRPLSVVEGVVTREDDRGGGFGHTGK